MPPNYPTPQYYITTSYDLPQNNLQNTLPILTWKVKCPLRVQMPVPLDDIYQNAHFNETNDKDGDNHPYFPKLPS